MCDWPFKTLHLHLSSFSEFCYKDLEINFDLPYSISTKAYSPQIIAFLWSIDEQSVHSVSVSEHRYLPECFKK